MKRFFSYTPNLGESFIVCMLFIVASMFIGGIGTLVLSLFGVKSGDGMLWFSALAYALSFAVVAAWVWHKGKNCESHSEKLFPLSKTLLGCLLIFTLSLGIVIEPLTTLISMPDYFKNLFAEMFQPAWPSFIMAVILAPLCEEWLCRGVIMKGLLKHSSPLKAILWSAVLFAVIHLNPWQAIPAFIIGCAMGWVYWRTGSLWASIFMHFVNNGLGFLLLVLFPNAPVDTGLEGIMGKSFWALYGLALLVLGFSIHALYTRFHSKEKE